LLKTRAVIFDYIGTLANPRRYTMDASIAKLRSALAEAGFPTDKAAFEEAYGKAHEKYRAVRFGELREVTNAVWVSETLCSLGFKVTAENKALKKALDVFFQDYIDSLELRSGAEKLLGKVQKCCKTGLVSNFTYAPVVRESIKKLGISGCFDAVVVSQECGWRKPHRKIFIDALTLLGVKAKEAVFVGDNPGEDIKGAAEAGLRTIFVQSQFFSPKDLQATGVKSDFVAKDLEEIGERLPEILRLK
jgi:HAD superfamily hydrolase (TIGR01549 family)